MEIDSPEQLGLGSMRRALNKLRGLFSVVAIVVRRWGFLFVQIWRRLNVLCAASADALEQCSFRATL